MKIKKLKKIMAGVLSAAMVMSTMAVTAFAAGETSTIDPDKKGSITLYKYYFENTEISEDLPDGTGEASDANNIPEGAKVLPGVEFSLWKIADIDGKVTIEGKTNQTFTAKNDIAEDSAAAEALIGDKPADRKAVTDEDGKAVFGKDGETSTLEQGFYYVKETDAPDNVTSDPVSFVVSVPMTNKDTAVGVDDNSGVKWIYDVVVYPKNATASAGMTIKKVDANGSDITSAKFVLQREETTGWKYVNRNGNDISYGNDNCADKDTFGGQETISGLTEGKYRLVEVSVGEGFIMDGTETYVFNVSDNGQITSDETEFSYNDGTGTDQTSATMTIKNERPDLEKDIKKGDGTWSANNDADYNIGDDVPYRVKVSVPSNIAKLKTFNITDVPTNLKFNNDLAIYTDADCTASANLTEDTDYTVDPDSTGNGFVVDFVVNGSMTEAFKAYAGQDLYLYYTAKLQSGAVITTAGNPNEVTLDYSNAIYPDNQPDMPNNNEDEKESHIKDHAIVYTFQIEVTKTTEDGETPLAGATFELYRCEQAGLKDESEIEAGKLIGTYTTDVDGLITQKGLENGNYYLIETKAPEDYNLLKAPVEVTLQVEYATSYSSESSWKLEDGEWVLVKHTVTSTTFTQGDSDAEDNNVTDGSYDFVIVNKKGFQLPTTGGAGTLLASLIGILLMGGGAFVFISSRKKKKAE